MQLDRRLLLAAGLGASLPLPAATSPEGPSRVTSQPGDKPYAAVALQLTARSVEGAADAAAVRAQVLAHIADVEVRLRSARIFIEQYGGAPVRLLAGRPGPWNPLF